VMLNQMLNESKIKNKKTKKLMCSKTNQLLQFCAQSQ